MLVCSLHMANVTAVTSNLFSFGLCPKQLCTILLYVHVVAEFSSVWTLSISLPAWTPHGAPHGYRYTDATQMVALYLVSFHCSLSSPVTYYCNGWSYVFILVVFSVCSQLGVLQTPSQFSHCQQFYFMELFQIISGGPEVDYPLCEPVYLFWESFCCSLLLFTACQGLRSHPGFGPCLMWWPHLWGWCLCHLPSFMHSENFGLLNQFAKIFYLGDLINIRIEQWSGKIIYSCNSQVMLIRKILFLILGG